MREGDQVYTRKAGGYEGRNLEDGGPNKAIYDKNCTFAKRDVTTTGRNKRDVWTIPTQSFPQAHFATFPEKLVQPCIKAGTSEKGCCPECGSPWVRVVEKENMVIDRSNRGEQLGKYGKTAASGAMVSPAKTTTIGWKPTCKCFGEFTGLQRATSIPCTVYDPFGGSMTTCLVAYKLNRHYIATELSQEYIEMGRKRIGAEKEKYSLLEG